MDYTNHQAEYLAKCFKVLGDVNRLAILNLLRGKKLCACELLRELSISQSTLSHHMKQLTELDLVSCEKVGKWCYYTTTAASFEKLADYLGNHANQQLRRP